MDIQGYQENREKDMQAFKSEYDDLKAQYARYLADSVYDPSNIDQVLETNKLLVELVNKFIAESQNKFDAKTIQDLTQQIISYQKEYQEIKTSQQQTVTLKNILNKENISLTNIQSEFNTYLWIFFGLVLILILLIFTVPSGYLPELPSLQLSTIS
jgi:hypothetical protein